MSGHDHYPQDYGRQVRVILHCHIVHKAITKDLIKQTKENSEKIYAASKKIKRIDAVGQKQQKYKINNTETENRERRTETTKIEKQITETENKDKRTEKTDIENTEYI